jgi:hypothetical protein
MVHAQVLVQDIVGVAGWSTIVRQQHSLHTHRLPTVRTDHRRRGASVDSDWRWHRLFSQVEQQPQLAAQPRQAATIAHTEQAVLPHLDQALWQDMLQEAVQELLGRQRAVCRLAALADCIAKCHLVIGHAHNPIVTQRHPKM